MMSLLSRAAPLARLRPAGWTPLRHLPFPALALAVCLLFAAAAAAVLDDYGIGRDGFPQRLLAEQNAAFIMGDRDALPTDHDRFYGIAFELPLLLAERLLGLRDSRDIFLTRHLLTHLFFIAGGFACGLLAWRMFNNRWLALLAMLLFLLHPRLYAHSYFNSKDIPFAVMFIIALYLTYRAFRRDTLGAFVLLGIVVGLAANTRPFALLLPAAVLAMRGLDWRTAPGSKRRRILLTAGVFAAATLLTIYASHPYYWENPLRYFDSFGELSRHPARLENLFQGRIIRPDAMPADYIPVWFGITAPPAALLLGAAGIAAILWQAWRAPGRIWRRGELRFRLLLLTCFALPIAVAIVSQAHIYDDWRQMYFLWGPFCLLAAAGLHGIWNTGRRKSILQLTRQIAGGGLAAAGLGGALYAIASLHPHQQIYFNLLANRAAPDELEQQYEMDHWRTSYFQGMEYLLARYPEATLYVRMSNTTQRMRPMLPAAERERIVLLPDWTDFFIHHYMEPQERVRTSRQGLAVYEQRAYGSAYVTVTAPRLVWGGGPRPNEDDYRAALRELKAAESLAAQSDFKVYLHNGALYYVRENCNPEDAAPRFFLHLYPVSDADLPADRREYGFEIQKFDFSTLGGFFDGHCITQEPLPDYPAIRIRTGQQTSGGETLWQAELNPYILARFQEIEAGLAGMRPVAAGAGFDIYLDGAMLVYRRETCDASDTAARFYLHLFPADTADLPADRREHGFVNRGFDFAEYGAMRDGKCLAAAPLSDYPIARIRTGQHIPGQGNLWQADFRPGQ